MTLMTSNHPQRLPFLSLELAKIEASRLVPTLNTTIAGLRVTKEVLLMLTRPLSNLVTFIH